MRNWVADKFGRNRVRTPRPAPEQAPTTAVAVPQRQQSTIGVWTRTIGTTGWGYAFRPWTTIPTTHAFWGPAPPTFPEKLRLPEGV